MLTIPLVAAILFLHEDLLRSPLLKHIFYNLIPLSALHTIFFPPDASPFIKYANAFLSVAYVIRAIELLLAYDLRQLKRAEGESSSYTWNTIPTSLGFQRFYYISDLIVNPRGIGWSYGSTVYNPSHRLPDEYSSFVKRQLFKLICTYVIFDSHQASFGRNFPAVAAAVQAAAGHLGIQLAPDSSAVLAREYLLGPFCWLAAYAFIDGFHALIALVDLGLLRPVTSARSEPWMYPTMFRSPRYILTCRLRDIWGKMWHDLCRRPLLAASLLLIPKDTAPPALKRFLVLCISFSVSGTLHAAGAYAVSQDGHAAAMMLVFFFVMALCTALQQLVAVGIARVFCGKVRHALSWVCDAVVLLAWAYYTCPWFIAYSMMPEAIASVPLPVSLWS
ncbi:hypothetical protein BDV59DRAFT_207742 [Aspergillus ambiguus]|uniref:wax synthase family protein n=1 Tax=Aspergillus ambiguus TaxID=176160 RepID=UPI003CCE4EFB